MTVMTQTLDAEGARFSAAATVQTGLRTLEFYAAAFSKTPDKNGDVIDPHAFDGWLQRFYAAGKPLAISFNHAAVLDSLDPTNVIGYAPADPAHVWVDDYGLRVKAYIDTASEKGKAVEWQIENGLIGGASIAYIVSPDGVVRGKSSNRITNVADVREAGPVPNPANQEAVLLWLKREGLLEEPSELPYMTVDEFRETFLKAVDTSAWDGNRAMTMCSSAADYRQICAAEHNIGTTDQRQHWAGPHHFLGRGPNEAGVEAALARWGTTFTGSQVQNITQAEWNSGLDHLRAHMREINPDYQPTASETLDELVSEIPDLDVLIKHAGAGRAVQSAHDALVRAGAKCAEGGAETTTASATEETDPIAARLRRLRFLKTSII